MRGKMIGSLLWLTLLGANASCMAEDVTYNQFAYTYNTGDNTITPYGIDPVTNVLRPLNLATIYTGQKPGGFGTHPSGKFIYLVNWDSNDISMYKPDLSTGNLITLGENVPCGGEHPWSLSVDPTGKFAYVTNTDTNNIAMFSIDQTTGRLSRLHTHIYPQGIIKLDDQSNPTSMVFDASGKFSYVAEKSSNEMTIFDVNQVTGDLIPRVRKVKVGKDPRKITIKNGYLYTVNQTSNSISMFKIDPISGDLTRLNPSSIDTGPIPIFMTIEPNGKYAYVTNNGDNTISMYAIGADGVLYHLNPATVPTGALPRNIYANNTQYIYNTNMLENSITMYKIDENTGQLVPQYPSSVATGYAPEGIAFTLGK